jgi:predicted aconitase
LTGRAPKAGVYLDENRLASVWITVQPVDDADNSFWPILGYTIGARASSRIPVITGLEDMKPSTDDFKAFSAAFATSSSAAMFHMVNQTPEAPTSESVCPDGFPRERIDLDWKDLDSCWEEFNNGSEPREVDLISFGNPHFSFQEIKQLAHLCRGRRKHDDVAVIVTCGRAQHGLATQAGYVGELEDFGVQFLTDTCWCSIEEPVIPKPVKVIMTNSGKYIHYGPGLTGRRFCFGSLEMCAEAAVSGWSTGDPPAWLQKARRI